MTTFLSTVLNQTSAGLGSPYRTRMSTGPSHGAEQREEFHARVVDPITQTITPEFAAGFVARSVWLMPVILDNAKTFSKAVAVHLGSSRIGDQIGTLLAGAFSQISDKRVSPEAARKWVQEQEWGDA